MRLARPRFSSLRRLAVFGAALVVTVLSCTRDITAPDSGAGRVARGLSFQTAFPTVFGDNSTLQRDLVPFTTVHVVLRHSDGSVALDTLVTFPAGAESLTLDLSVTLLPSAPTTGEPLTVTLDYINAQGEIVFHGGPVTVLAAPGLQTTTPVTVPVTYTGTGSNAKSVRIAPRTLSVFTGDNFAFTAAALDATGAQIAGTPIAWSSPDAAVTMSTTGDGTGTAGATRGTARIVAQLLTGPADTAMLTIQPKPSTIAAVSGDGQTAAVRSPLVNPVVVHVGASDGGGVSGVAVSVAVDDSGSVDSATVHTGADGNASVHWTLGKTVGPQTLTASVDGLSGSPVSFHATSTAGTAAKLLFTTVPDTVAAGTGFGVAVAASDALGNTATSFTGTVTIALGANPGSDVLGGTLTASAVAGVANFSGLTLSKVGAGYTINAAASGLAAATSAPIVVKAGAVAACTLVSGGGQSAAAGSALGPIAVRATDAKANPVAGAPLSGVVSNGGTLAVAAPVTDATGQAIFNWTLGGTAGAQTLSITCGATTLVVNATATSVSAIKTWTGATSTVWSTAANWSPSGAPASTDSIIVPVGTNQPSLAANTTVKSLVVATGATLTLGANTLTVTGSLDAGNTIVGTGGSVLLTGSGTVRGAINAPVVVTGTYTLTNGSSWGSDLTVNGSGALTLGGKALSVGGNFVTGGSGTVVMTAAADTLNVTGNATFSGGDETGKLTAGELVVSGNLVQSTTATSLVAGPAFVTRLTGATQSITFANPTTSMLGGLAIAGSAQAALASNMTIVGNVWVQTGGTPRLTSTPADTATIGGSLYDSTGGRWQAATTKMTGANKAVPRVMTGNVVFAASQTLADSLTVNGSVGVQGAGAVLDVNGHVLVVVDSLSTSSGGALKMTNAADTVFVLGDASFMGGSTAGMLTDGYLAIAGAHFTQGGTSQSFSADGPHVTDFADSVSGAASHTITFANPGAAASHFGDLYIGDTLTYLGSNVYAAGELETGISISHRVTTSTGDHLLTSNGSDVRNLTFDNTRWLLQGTDNVSSMDYVTFQNISNTAATQFEWNRPGTGTHYTSPYGWSFYTQPTTGLYIKMTSSAPADTLEMGVSAPALNGGFVQALGGGVILGWPNYALYTGGNHGVWNTFGNWNNSGSLIPDSTMDVVIPFGDTISLSGNAFAKNLTLDSGAVVSQGNYDLEVHGNLRTDTLSGGFQCTTGITYQPEGPPATLVGRLCRYHSGRPITQVGPVTVSQVFHVHDSTYTFNSHKVTTQEAWVGTTVGSSGALSMTHPGDSLIVSDSMQVGGNFGATPSAGVSSLSAGYVQVGGSFFVYGAPGAGYFNASAGHQTRLSGSGGSSVLFTDTTASRFGTLTVDASRVLASPARVAGNVYLIASAGLSGGAGRLKVGGNLYGTSTSSITTNAFELAGVNSDTGTFSPDTAVYTGTGQVIADSLGAGLGGYSYKSIRVAGTATIQPYGSSGSIYMTGKLVVTGQLRVGNGNSFLLYVGDSLITSGSGVLKLLDPNSTLQVSGNALFAGGSTAGSLTAGTLELDGNVAQTSANSAASFAATSGLTTKLGGSGQVISFASPATGGAGSHFGGLLMAAASTPPVQLASNVFADGQLAWLSPTDTAAFAGSGATLTVQGANVQGSAGWHLTFNDVMLKLVDGAAFTKLDGVTFTNFGTATPFEFGQTTAGTYNLNYLSWEYGTTPYQPSSPLIKVSSPAGVTVNVVTPSPGQVYWIANLLWYLLNSGGATVNISP